MSFYQDLSKYYQQVFPVGAQQLNFLEEQFNQGKILDVACGDGAYTVALAQRGFQMVGFDLEEEMIKLAQERLTKLQASEEGDMPAKGLAPVEFQTGDMSEAATFGTDFTGLFCIGNSLAHLTDQAVLARGIRGFYDALAPKGVAVIQLVNFDYMVGNKVPGLSTISRETLTFQRKYHYREDGLIDFSTVLTVAQEGKELEFPNKVVLRPIFKADLASLFSQAGFNKLEFYGGFDGRPYEKDGSATIMVAQK